MSSLGSRLRAARKRKGWSQTYVCKRLGISNSALSGYERDYREPDVEQINRLADLYETKADYLLGRTDDFSSGNNTGTTSSEIKNKVIEEVMKLSDEDAHYIAGLIRRIRKSD